MIKNKLFISSADRSSGTPSDFRLDLSHSIQACTGISLGRIRIPNTFYSIDENNRQLDWLEDSTSLTTTLDLGSYQVGDSDTDAEAGGFLYLLKTAMDDSSAADGASKTYEVSYDKPTGLLSISTSDSTSLTITKNQPLCSVLGITNDKTDTLIVSDRQLNLRGISTIYIESSLPIVSRIGNQQRSILASFSVDGQFAGLNTQQDWSADFDMQKIQATTISHIDLRLTDHSGRIVNNRGHDWSAQLFYTTLPDTKSS